MIHRLVTYQVRKEELPKVLDILRQFVDEVERKEGGTAFYHAYQDQDEPTHFTHIMAFRTPSAEDYHRKTAWCKRFVEELYPRCVEEPRFATVARVGKSA